MVNIRISYQGGLRCEAVHGPSGCRLTTDAPVDNRGRGESFSPTDLLATSLIACMATIMGIRAEDHGWDLEGMHMEVQKVMSKESPRRVIRLVVKVHMPAGFPVEHRETAVDAAMNCPVFKSIDPEIDVPVEFLWA